MNEGSYSKVARAINEELAPASPVSRQQVYEWYTRGTRNAAGEPFLDPVRRDEEAAATKPRLFFSVPQTIAWRRAGLSENSMRQGRNRLYA